MKVEQASILVVDDSPIDRRLAGAVLARRNGFTVTHACDGEEALAAVAAQRPDLVLTDLLMPRMNGLELVERIRADHPILPVVLMTAHGSEDTAVEALRRGAASYVPKRHLAGNLVATIEDILAIAVGDHRVQEVARARHLLVEKFEIDNDPAAMPALVRHLEAQLAAMALFDDTERMQVAVALREALVNAIYHGNLELTSTAKEEGFAAWEALARERRQSPPYANRRVRVSARHTRDEVAYVVRDEGPGFDPSTLPDPTVAANIERVHGRGLMLIRTFMDEVVHDASGTTITMIKRRH